MNRILFLCTGNTCRSPMAEAILNAKQLSDVEVKSAGLHAAQGQDTSSGAKTVMGENNLAHTHQSTPLSSSEVDWATLILTMTESHKQAIAAAYPQAIEKTFTLKEYVKPEEVDRDVTDPFGGNETVYRKTFAELKELIEELLLKIGKDQ